MLKELLYFSDLPPLFILVLMEETLRALLIITIIITN